MLVRRTTIAILISGSTLALPLTSCGGLPKRGKANASIRMGYPRVVSRERFIQERNDDLKWLRDQLANEDMYAQGMQGNVISRVFDNAQTNIKLRANLVEQLQDLGALLSPQSGSENIENAGASNNSPAEVTDQQLANALATLSPADLKAILADTANFGDQPAISSPSDRLDDGLAFRDSVRSAIHQRSLDDTHDLQGNTLHELTFDLSLFPGYDAGSPYVVTVDVKGSSASKDGIKQILADSLIEYANYESVARASRIIGGVQSTDLEWLSRIESGARVLASYYQLLDAHNLYMSIYSTQDSDICLTRSEVQLACIMSVLNLNDDCTSDLEYKILTRFEELRKKHGNRCSEEIDRSTDNIEQTNNSDPDENAADANHSERPSQIDEEIEDEDSAGEANTLPSSSGLNFSITKHLEAPDSRYAPEIVGVSFPSTTTIRKPDDVSKKEWLCKLLQKSVLDDYKDIARQYLAAVDVGREVREQTNSGIRFAADSKQGACSPDDYVLRFDTVSSSGDSTTAFAPVLTICCLNKFPLNKAESGNKPKAIAVSPTEQGEVYGVDLGSAVQRAITTDIKAVLGTRVDGGLDTQRLRQEILKVAQLERNPLVVGFVNMDQSKSQFGWLLGPSLEARQSSAWFAGGDGAGTGVEEWYRHRAIHHPVTATIVAPAYMDQLDLNVNLWRIESNGTWTQICTQSGHDRYCACDPSGMESLQINVRVPVDGDAYARGLIYGNDRLAGAPSVVVVQPEKVMSGKAGSFLLQGVNLWRNPEVYIGGTRATDVEPTADLDGLHVKLNPVPLPIGHHNVTVITSAGEYTIPDAIEVIGTTTIASLATTKALPIQSSGELTVSFVLSKALEGWSDFRLRVRKDMKGKPLYEGSVDSVRLKDKGRRVEVSVKIPQAELVKTAGELEIDLYVIPTPGGDAQKLTSQQSSWMISKQWLEKQVTPITASKAASGKEFPIGTEFEFDYGIASWDPVREVWPNLTDATLTAAIATNGSTLKLAGPGKLKLTIGAVQKEDTVIKVPLGTSGPTLHLKLKSPPKKK